MFKVFDEDRIPEGSEIVFKESGLEALSPEEVDALYSRVAGTPTKKFKNKSLAVKSLMYQAAKLPDTPGDVQKTAENHGETVPAGDKKKKEAAAKVKSEVLVILRPANLTEVVEKLAPQAREVFSILCDAALAHESNTLSAEQVADAFKDGAAKTRLGTRQEPARILQYYKGRLKGAGLIRTE